MQPVRTKSPLALVLSSLAILLALLDPAPASAVTNDFVRFRITYGDATKYYRIDFDVELFTQDKPVTVSNFLAYVRSGRYDNSILHRLQPFRILQGGDVRVTNPYSHDPFAATYAIDSFGPITNEFFSGTIRSNLFGTLSMGLRSGDPNSATASWFFNLGDNHDLDADSGTQGPFTVFGQVSTNGLAPRGLELLRAFNTHDLNFGIMDTSTSSYDLNGCAPVVSYPDGDTNRFVEVPVVFTDRPDCVHYHDLYKVQILENGQTDVIIPRVTVTSPKTGAVVTTNFVVVSGTAEDNNEVAKVVAYSGENAFAASGTNSWSIVVTNLVPGTNRIYLEGTDTQGNHNQAVLSVFYSVKYPVSLAVSGGGTISGLANGQLLELTRTYSATARPGAGYRFLSWTGSVNSATSRIDFVMATNTAVTAVFLPNPFPGIKGVYSGLFHDTNEVEFRSSGFVTLTLTERGLYSGRVLWNGRTARWSGAFLPDGGSTNVVTLNSSNQVRFLMVADLSGGSDRITGEVTNSLFRSQLALDRAVFTGRGTNSSPWAGRYTMVLPRDTNAVVGPAGEGFAAVTSDARGVTTLAGVLGDGTRLASTGPISKRGSLPFFAPLYRGAGLAVGWLQFDTNQPTTDLSGLVNWTKPRLVAEPYNGLGFTNEMMLQGSRYTPPPGAPLLALTTASIGFTNGNLPAFFANDLLLDPDGAVTVPNGNTNKLSVSFTRATGLFSGAVTPPYLTTPVPFKGAVLQKQSRGSGLLFGTTRTSQVELGPQVEPEP